MCKGPVVGWSRADALSKARHGRSMERERAWCEASIERRPGPGCGTAGGHFGLYPKHVRKPLKVLSRPVTGVFK